MLLTGVELTTWTAYWGSPPRGKPTFPCSVAIACLWPWEGLPSTLGYWLMWSCTGIVYTTIAVESAWLKHLRPVQKTPPLNIPPGCLVLIILPPQKGVIFKMSASSNFTLLSWWTLQRELEGVEVGRIPRANVLSGMAAHTGLLAWFSVAGDEVEIGPGTSSLEDLGTILCHAALHTNKGLSAFLWSQKMSTLWVLWLGNLPRLEWNSYVLWAPCYRGLP